MLVTRNRTLGELIVGLLLLGGACSGTSNSASDASRGIDGPGNAADVNQVVDGPAAQATDVQVVDSPTAQATDVQVVDSPAAQATDVNLADSRVARETEAGDSGIACTGEYRACECGCCDGGLAKAACYYPSRGESVSTTESWDRMMSAPNADPKCNLNGCIRYVCCPALAAEPTSAATYAVEWINLGAGMAGLQISKKGADCASILTYPPGENYTGISHSEVNWGLHVSNVGACGDGGAGQAGIGGVGEIRLTPTTTSGCVPQVSLHATVFGLRADGSVQAVRMDVDTLPSCP